MKRIYVSPAIGRSMDIPDKIKPFFKKEECEYRSTCTVEQLTMGGYDFPENFGESFKYGREIVKETITNMFGEKVDIVSWDHPGFRYFFEVNDSIESGIDEFVEKTGIDVSALNYKDVEDASEREYVEIIYGEPVIEDWFAEV